MLICYADDSGIWYKITDENRDNIVDIINSDLHNLSKWALDNNTTFEPTKYLGNIHNIWLKIPKDIRELGMAKGWDKHKRIIKKSIGKKILNHWEKTGENNKQLSKLISKVQCR